MKCPSTASTKQFPLKILGQKPLRQKLVGQKLLNNPIDTKDPQTKKLQIVYVQSISVRKEDRNFHLNCWKSA